MIQMKTGSILMSVLMLVGCASSPPVQFFTLDPISTQPPSVHRNNTTLQVAAIHIPALLDRQEMVRKTAANTIEVSDQHRWAAPFGQMAQRVLTQDLAQRLPAGSVILPNQPAPPGTALVVVDILQFETDAKGTVVFDGSWSLLHEDTHSTPRNYPLHLSAQTDAAGYKAQARAMSQIMGRIADAIKAQVSGDTEANDRKR